MQKHELHPSPPGSDAQFVRRASLDLKLQILSYLSMPGRSHHPFFSTVLAGGRAKAGFLYCKSDNDGYYVEEMPFRSAPFTPALHMQRA
ncbi:MAG: hypothetical protein AAF483_20280 [Planctomycetota bacterium]